MLLHSKIKLGLSVLVDENNEKCLLLKVDTSIMCFESLRRVEMMLIEIKDALIGKLANEEFPRTNKHRTKVFRLKLPD